MFHTTVAAALIFAAKMHEATGKIVGDPDWLMSLPNVGPKTTGVVMKAAFNEDWMPPVDSHVFSICRAGRMVLDGDVDETRVAKTLLQYWPRSKWCVLNTEFGCLGQLMDRGGEDTQQFVDCIMRFRDPKKQHIKHWLIRIMTSPVYIARAGKFLIPHLQKNTELQEHMVCRPRGL